MRGRSQTMKLTRREHLWGDICRRTLSKMLKYGASLMRALLIVGLCLWTSSSFAEVDLSGSYFLPVCKRQLANTPNPSLIDAYDRGICVGFVETLLSMGPSLEPKFRFCAPPEMTVNQAIGVSVAFLEARPQMLHEAFLSLAMRAFKLEW